MIGMVRAITRRRQKVTGKAPCCSPGAVPRLQQFNWRVGTLFLAVLLALMGSLFSGAALAVDPNHVSFKLEGCRFSALPSGFDLEGAALSVQTLPTRPVTCCQGGTNSTSSRTA